jgi:hypothetical protein
MIIYEDIFTGKEIFSDAYPCKLIDDFVYEAEGMSIVIDNTIDDSCIGGNASAEDADEGGADDSKETAINLVYAFKLKPYEIDKKGYTKHIKDYGKKLVEKIKASGASDEEVDAFKAKMAKKCGEIVKNFKDYDVYINEDYNEDGMLPLLNYREDGTTPYFTYFAAGVKGVKC